jgi:hypothetical protein
MRIFVRCLPLLLAVPLMAQPQIGGGTCSSASLKGTYSATLSGRDLSSSVGFTSVLQGVGTVNFDGLSKVTFTFTNNTNKFSQVSQTLSGTYNLQSNCIGTISITTGDTASFTLEAYNNALASNSYLITGQDGVYSFTGGGSLLPATCPTAIPAGSYSFNGNGFGLSAGAIAAAFDIAGVVQIGATSGTAITVASYITTSTGTTVVNSTGTITVMPNCSASATLTDSVGASYIVTMELTSATGQNFILSSSSGSNIFSGTGRLL